MEDVPDIISLLGGADDPAAQTQALAAALRRQRNAEGFQTLAAFRGGLNPQLFQRAAGDQAAAAERQGQEIAKVPVLRQAMQKQALDMEQNKQQMQKGGLDIQKEQADMAEATRLRSRNQAAANPLRRSLAAQFGLPVNPNATNEDLADDLLKMGEGATIARENRAGRLQTAAMHKQDLASVRQQALDFKKEQSKVPFTELIDENEASALLPQEKEMLTNIIGAQKGISDRAAGIRQLLPQIKGLKQLDPNGTEVSLIKRQMAELLPLVVQNGGFGAMTQGHQHLAQQVIGDSPINWINQLHSGRFEEMLNELENAAKKNTTTRLASHNLRIKANAPSLTAESGADPRDAAAVQWATANPTDPRAVKILKLHGLAK